MNVNKRPAGLAGLILCSAIVILTGCAVYQEPPRQTVYAPAPPVYVPEPPPAYVPPPAEVSVSASLPVGEGVLTIRAESDFYEPLTPYGRWEVVGNYGRCWIPGRVDREWRPYCNGAWQRTEAGWYWASDEP